MVYICSPLRGEYAQNIKNANRYCKIAAGLGVLPLAPHTIFTQYLNDTIPEQRRRGLDLGLALLEKCEELWVMGPQISEGMQGEIQRAKALGMPTYQIENPLEAKDYPISSDGVPLLGLHSCIEGMNMNWLAPGDIVVIRHDYLHPAYRTADDQLGIVDNDVPPGAKWDKEKQVILWNPRTDEQVLFDRAAIIGFPKVEVVQRAQDRLAALNDAAPGREADMEDGVEH